MKRICTLKKSFNDGTEILVEFVNVIPNKNRMVIRRIDRDGTKEVNVYNNIDDERVQRDIAMHKSMGYKERSANSANN